MLTHSGADWRAQIRGGQKARGNWVHLLPSHTQAGLFSDLGGI